ncbi:unnamed protein product [Closterium sp. Yama58-4]|nr:unnamed protein product [Closterium sp. Yama58-4]
MATPLAEPQSHDNNMPYDHEAADEGRLAAAAATADGADSPIPVTRREEWGWYLYDVAVSAFYSVALPVFFPLLLNQLASDAAWQQAGQPRPPDCGVDGVAVYCAQCVPGEGMQLLTSAGYSLLPNPKVQVGGGASIDPVAFATVTLGLSVVCQVVAFITLGPLADYGMGRMRLLQGGTAMGIAACALCMALVSPSLWWLSGLLLIIANVGYGLAIVAYYSYLPVLVDAAPPVLLAAQLAVNAQAELSGAAAANVPRAAAGLESAEKAAAEGGGEEGEKAVMGALETPVAEPHAHAGRQGCPEAFVAVDSCGVESGGWSQGDLFTPLLVTRDQEENRMSLTGSVGLKAPWELFVFACWFGFFLGGLNAYSKTLFIDMIPVGREAAFFSLYSVSDKGSSWLGPFIVAIIVQITGELRPSFLYVFLVILIPLVCLYFFVNHQQGIVDAARVATPAVASAAVCAPAASSRRLPTAPSAVLCRHDPHQHNGRCQFHPAHRQHRLLRRQNSLQRAIGHSMRPAASGPSPATPATSPRASSSAASSPPPSSSSASVARPSRTPHSGYHYAPSSSSGSGGGAEQPFFEGWYFKVSLPDSRDSFAWMYSVENPSAPPPEAAASSSPGARKGGLPCLMMQAMGPAVDRQAEWGRGEAGAEGGGDARDYVYQQTADTGRFWGARHELALGACFQPREGQVSPLGEVPPQHSALALRAFEPHWQVCMAMGRARGWVEWQGHRIDFTDALTYSEKNWGGAFPLKWFWIQCNVWSHVSLGSAVALTVAGAKRQLNLPLVANSIEEVGMVGLHWEGQLIEFVPNRGVVEWKVQPWGSWLMHAQNEQYEVTMEAHTLPGDNGTPLRAPTAEGMRFFCKDSFDGRVTLELRQRYSGQLLLRAESTAAAVEVGGGPWWEAWEQRSRMNPAQSAVISLPLNLSSLLPPSLQPPGL